jgi:acetoin utilization deacetylase AcuC-like enzyme
VLVSAGFDTHRNDPLGGMTVTEGGFARMTKMLMNIAEAECAGKLLLVLEGGYDIQALTNSVEAVIQELRKMPAQVHVEANGEPGLAVMQTVASVKQVLKPYWSEL